MLGVAMLEFVGHEEDSMRSIPSDFLAKWLN